MVVLLTIELIILVALLVGLIVISNRDKSAEVLMEPESGVVQNKEMTIAEPETTETESLETEHQETEPEVMISEDLSIGETVPNEENIPEVEIETLHGNLYYPGQWKEYLVTQIVELDFGVDVVFFAAIEGENYWLFTVHYGGADGIPIGVLNSQEGYMLDVTVEISEFIPENSWSAENKELFSAMQEAVNHVINKLSQTPGFEM